MAIDLLVIGFFYHSLGTSFFLAAILSFIALFSISSGPITWLYMSEIMADKAVTIATFINWCLTLLISLTSLTIYDQLQPEQ